MKIKYIIVAIILLGCSHEDTSVTGYVIAEGIGTSALDSPPVLPETSLVDDSDNPSTTETVEAQPTFLIQPRLLIPQNLLNNNTNQSDVAPQPQVLPVATSIDATDADANDTETTVQDDDKTITPTDVSEVVFDEPPVDGSDNSSTIETTEDNPVILAKPLILTAPKPVNNNPNESNSLPTPQVSSVTNSSLCSHLFCPMIVCLNELPAIPSEGICCPRCVLNSKCNTTACPKYKCSTYIIPANLTAGECCDHCAPASVKSTATTKKTSTKPTKLTSTTKKNTGKPKTTKPSLSFQEDENSSSEEDDGTPLGYNKRPCNPTPNRSYSRLICLLTEALAYLRNSQSYQEYDDFDD